MICLTGFELNSRWVPLIKGFVAPDFQVSVKFPYLIFKQCTIIILIFLSLFPFPQQNC